ncbi:hypothetical protein [Ancrocorticia sp.]|uniref:hypothetical protein n=1 Tax=Ancrocorticia sp. TaxID=2593684 RepID=UPI003F908465
MDVVVLINVDRFEQRLVAQTPVRVVSVGIDVSDIGQQQQRVIQIGPGIGVLAVVGPDPKVDGLQRCGDPVLFPFEQVEWDRARVVGLEELGLLAFQFGTARGEFGQFCRTLAHHLVELGVQHARECLPGLGGNLDMGVEMLDQALHVLDQHRLTGAVTPSSMAG